MAFAKWNSCLAAATDNQKTEICASCASWESGTPLKNDYGYRSHASRQTPMPAAQSIGLTAFHKIICLLSLQLLMQFHACLKLFWELCFFPLFFLEYVAKGARFTLGVWGLRRVRSTLLLCPQPSATVV
jgi:hypothetical protein